LKAEETVFLGFGLFQTTRDAELSFSIPWDMLPEADCAWVRRKGNVSRKGRRCSALPKERSCTVEKSFPKFPPSTEEGCSITTLLLWVKTDSLKRGKQEKWAI